MTQSYLVRMHTLDKLELIFLSPGEIPSIGILKIPCPSKARTKETITFFRLDEKKTKITIQQQVPCLESKDSPGIKRLLHSVF